MTGPVVRLGGDPPSPYERRFSFSRVVRAGDLVIVGGTTAVDPSGVVVGDTAGEQTTVVLRKLAHELQRVGAALSHVVESRVYVTDISRAEEVGRAHAEFFGDLRPCMTMVQVAALIDPRMLVEVEALAVVAPA